MKKGDKVVCIDTWNTTLEHGKIYTIKEVDSDNAFQLEGMDERWFFALRFVSAKEQKPVENSICTCDIMTLMSDGCKCGQIQREKCANNH